MLDGFIEKLKGQDFLSKESFSQFRRYVITGFLSFGVEYSFFALLYGLVIEKYFVEIYRQSFSFARNFLSLVLNLGLTEDSFRAIFAGIIVYPIVFVINFSLNRRWSFKSKSKLSKQMLMYGGLFIINLFLGNVLLTYFLTHTLAISPYVAKVLIMGFMVSWNFVLYKKVIYK